ncbi:MAG: uncharacterized protein KVP18_001573 [Porospora cf. gigantea A]|uniref:uncharacterized protein n=1 Tax=Porospora cf. gigantea A TaxID=2853593 RepID=UPI003559AECC|nr:MAG: hypothetical protein KVP18_001573 [Porospora cf. gigantea A]
MHTAPLGLLLPLLCRAVWKVDISEDMEEGYSVRDGHTEIMPWEWYELDAAGQNPQPPIFGMDSFMAECLDAVPAFLREKKLSYYTLDVPRLDGLEPLSLFVIGDAKFFGWIEPQRGNREVEVDFQKFSQANARSAKMSNVPKSVLEKVLKKPALKAYSDQVKSMHDDRRYMQHVRMTRQHGAVIVMTFRVMASRLLLRNTNDGNLQWYPVSFIFAKSTVRVPAVARQAHRDFSTFHDFVSDKWSLAHVVDMPGGAKKLESFLNNFISKCRQAAHPIIADFIRTLPIKDEFCSVDTLLKESKANVKWFCVELPAAYRDANTLPDKLPEVLMGGQGIFPSGTRVEIAIAIKPPPAPEHTLAYMTCDNNKWSRIQHYYGDSLKTHGRRNFNACMESRGFLLHGLGG